MIISETKSIGICVVTYYASVGPLENHAFDEQRKCAFSYCFSGSGLVHTGTALQTAAPDTLFDLRGLSSADALSISVGTDSAAWAGFIAIDPSEELDATLLQPGTYDLIKSEISETLFVTKGGIVANGKSIPVRGFANLPDGREIRVEIPEGSLAIHFKKSAILSDTPL